MITVVGQLADELGAAYQTEAVASTDPGRSFDVRHRAWSFSSLEYRRAQPAPIMVDMEHDGVAIGTVRYLERTAGGRLFAVCEVDASDVGDGPWFFSPEITHTEGRDITLDALAFTRSPSSIGLSAVTAFPGPLAEAAPKMVRQHGLPGQLVKRAREYDKRRRPGEGHVIAERANTMPPFDDLRSARPYGPIRHGPVVPGSVLRVS